MIIIFDSCCVLSGFSLTRESWTWESTQHGQSCQTEKQPERLTVGDDSAGSLSHWIREKISVRIQDTERESKSLVYICFWRLSLSFSPFWPEKSSSRHSFIHDEERSQEKDIKRQDGKTRWRRHEIYRRLVTQGENRTTFTFHFSKETSFLPSQSPLHPKYWQGNFGPKSTPLFSRLSFRLTLQHFYVFLRGYDIYFLAFLSVEQGRPFLAGLPRSSSYVCGFWHLFFPSHTQE